MKVYAQVQLLVVKGTLNEKNIQLNAKLLELQTNEHRIVGVQWISEDLVSIHLMLDNSDWTLEEQEELEGDIISETEEVMIDESE